MTDHILELSHSKDGSHTGSDFSQHDIGDTGAFLVPVIKRRLGVARHMVVTARVSSPYPRNVIGMSVMTEPAG